MINHDDVADGHAHSHPHSRGLLGPPQRSVSRSSVITGAPSPGQLSRQVRGDVFRSKTRRATHSVSHFFLLSCLQGSSVESTTIVPIHHHTAECAGPGRSLHQPTQHSKVSETFTEGDALAHHSKRVHVQHVFSGGYGHLVNGLDAMIVFLSLQRGSPTSNECDFHCCSLHVGSSTATTATHKTVATSPITVETAAAAAAAADPLRRSLPKGAHVRFSSEVEDGAMVAGPAGIFHSRLKYYSILHSQY